MTNEEAIRILSSVTFTLPSGSAIVPNEFNAAYFLAIKALENEPKKGEWIITSEDNNGIHRILCPFCKFEKGSNFMDYITVTFEKLPPFCECCGADMRGDANGL